MKYLIIYFLLISSSAVASTWQEESLGNLVFNTSPNFNGEIDYVNSSSWIFKGRENSSCTSNAGSRCRRVNIKSDGAVASDRVTKYSFDFKLTKFDMWTDLEWMILFQDWVQIVPGDSNGNHPISTIKIFLQDGDLKIGSYDNSWQWGFDYTACNTSGSAIDVNHDYHQKNRLNGSAIISRYTDYTIDVIIYDSGRFIFKLDGNVISDTSYQTKSPTANHVIMWGQYWDKNYYEPIDLKITNFKKWVLNP